MELTYDNCPNCFEELKNSEICPHCKFELHKVSVNPNILKPFSILNNRYIIGRLLGQGGFGITYIAKDIKNGQLCAIKEYMPVEFAMRSGDGQTVTMNDSRCGHVYEHGKKRFLDEANTLFNLRNNPIVVRIMDYFSEHNTGYLVMEYLDGVNLKGYARLTNDKVDPEYAKSILVIIASALMEIHRKGILHRDLSPENIFITRYGEIKLIDFGAARNYISEQNKNGMSVLLKPGFAPPEQYDSLGEQGPWTDIYALAATYYYVVSGKKPMDSLYLMQGSKQLTLHELNSDISWRMSKAIEKAMRLKIKERYQSFEEFLNDIDIESDMEQTIEPEELPEPLPLPIPMSNLAPQPKPREGFFFRLRKKLKGKKKVPAVTVLSGESTGKKMEIAVGVTLKIGRSNRFGGLAIDGCTNISRVHCQVEYDHAREVFLITDFSANGTFMVNGERLQKEQEYELNGGDKFYLVTPNCMLKVDLEDKRQDVKW